MAACGLKDLVGGQVSALKAEKVAGPGKVGVPTNAEMDAVEAVGGPDRGRVFRVGRFGRIFVNHGVFKCTIKAGSLLRFSAKSYKNSRM
jgi:hypothetical protein